MLQTKKAIEEELNYSFHAVSVSPASERKGGSGNLDLDHALPVLFSSSPRSMLLSPCQVQFFIQLFQGGCPRFTCL